MLKSLGQGTRHSGISAHPADEGGRGAHDCSAPTGSFLSFSNFQVRYTFTSRTKGASTSYRTASSSWVEAKWPVCILVLPRVLQFSLASSSSQPSSFPNHLSQACQAPAPDTETIPTHTDFLINSHNDIRSMCLLPIAAQQITSKQ